MSLSANFKKWSTDILYSFPVQLVVLHFRNNLLLLGVWTYLALLMTGVLGRSFGIRYLFLDPEYLGVVDFKSFFIVGLSFGILFMIWNLSTYLLSTHYFPFLATLKRPFTKFCLNNSLVPLLFFGIYIGYAVYFQKHYEYWATGQIIFNLLGFCGGIVLTILLFSLYFQLANKDISYYEKNTRTNYPNLKILRSPGYRGLNLEEIKADKNRWRVDTYLNEALRPRAVRSVAHYDSRFLLRIFKQNHLNALVVQLAILLFLLFLGYLMDYPFFRIPAGASIFLLSSIIISVIGAVNYWLHKWRIFILLFLVIGLNFLTRFSWFNYDNRAYGLNYDTPAALYDVGKFAALCSPENINRDIDTTRVVLKNWHQKTGKTKPKMVLFAVSGGGLKASVWTMQVIQKCDSMLNGALMRHTVLITGASGGMIGAAYYRDLCLQQHLGAKTNPHDPAYLARISQDLLNSVSFAIVSNDVFMPSAPFEWGGYRYIKDRGYMFEKQLNENTDYALDKPLRTYRQPELDADIPMLVVSPAVVNDARRLLISPLGLSYLTMANVRSSGPGEFEVDAVDFRRVFAEQDADNLRFLSALRMSATYPYILPNVHLPSQPGVEVMDAGFRDNMGILSATRFLQVFKNWILENTSGVILIQISSVKDRRDIAPSDNQGIVESLLNPLGILTHIVRLQDFEHEASLGFITEILGKENFEIIRFNYAPSPENERASMTFHLTRREKNDILNAFFQQKNQEGVARLKEMLD
ncbi:MAG TPA: patatin-like phospholipase family protein [Saprospiraceae bacterium]|nr:patatin-like phospholipase family protein [Saprospiraceae bacterium]